MKIEDFPKEVLALRPFYCMAANFVLGIKGWEILRYSLRTPNLGSCLANDDEYFLQVAKRYKWFITEKAYDAFCDCSSSAIFYECPDIEYELYYSPNPMVNFSFPNYYIVYHVSERKELDEIFTAAKSTPVKEEIVTEVQPKLGTPEWPDDVVVEKVDLTGLDTENKVYGFYFPTHRNSSMGEYRHLNQDICIQIDGAEGGSLAGYIEYWSDSRSGRYVIHTPEQVFSLLKVFSTFLATRASGGLKCAICLGQGCGCSVEEVMVLRNQVYKTWFAQHFPHLAECRHGVITYNQEGEAICDICGQVVSGLQKAAFKKQCKHEHYHVDEVGVLLCLDCGEMVDLHCDCEACNVSGRHDRHNCHFDCHECPVSLLNGFTVCTSCGRDFEDGKEVPVGHRVDQCNSCEHCRFDGCLICCGCGDAF